MKRIELQKFAEGTWFGLLDIDCMETRNEAVSDCAAFPEMYRLYNPNSRLYGRVNTEGFITWGAAEEPAPRPAQDIVATPHFPVFADKLTDARAPKLVDSKTPPFAAGDAVIRKGAGGKNQGGAGAGKVSRVFFAPRWGAWYAKVQWRKNETCVKASSLKLASEVTR